ncbi:hypothetical protein A9257_20865 [Vibrio cyclitrophicus]|uniref:glycosyltransferase family 2 protein n=1 Tax=Vibrio cyclitrophicus TaxID=47951 RepID=UPI0007EEA5F3|nr:glycosyltransferase family 2 protein [Vibrio cyclitrophicus]OBT02716.1 hypothetical protein A9257_20865 [Vibrio cyclitrophicus]
MLFENKVSIIVPIYNVESIIINTIESVLKQNYRDWELLLIDDSSTDGTRQVLERYSDKDARIKCFFSEINLGAGGARNIGLELATGRFIAFLDSDDLWHPNKLEKQISFMKSRNAPICHTSFSFINEDGEPRKGGVDVSESVSLIDNLRSTEIATSTAVIDRNLVTECFKFSLIRARQDIKLWIDLLSLGYASYGLDEKLVCYRVRKGSVSSNKVKMLWITFKVYLNVRKLSVVERLVCYFFYVFNAIKKRNS